MRIWNRVKQYRGQSEKTYHTLIKAPKQKERKNRAEAIMTEFLKID